MATESVDEILLDYRTKVAGRAMEHWEKWPNKAMTTEELVDLDTEAKQRIDAYYTRECARKVLEGRIDELANIYIARTVPKKSFQLFSMKLTPWPKLEDRLKQLESELRAALKEVGGDR